MVPAIPVAIDVLGDIGLFRLEGRVHGPVRQVQKKGLSRIRCFPLRNHGDSVIGDVVGEVVAVGVLIDVDQMVIGDEPMGLVHVGKPVEDPVKPIKATLAWPRPLRTRRAAMGVLGQMPFADHQGRIAVIGKDFRHRRRVIGEFHRVSGKARISVRDRTDSDAVWIAAGQQRGAGR